MKIIVDDKGRHLYGTGYGRVARSVIEALCLDPDNTVCVPYGLTTIANLVVPPITSKNFSYVPVANIDVSDFDLSICVGQPRSARNLGCKTLMFTMVDVSDLPQEWIKALSVCDGFITPASKIKSIFDKHFKHVYKVPLYSDNNTFKPRGRWRDEGSDKFSFIYLGTFSYRKGVDILLDAFTKEFSYNEAKLTLVCSESQPDYIFEKVMEVMGKRKKLSDISLKTRRVSDAWIARFYARHDCFVTFTRGEGWGYPIAEAALCGLPIIAPQNLPSDDFLNKNYNFLSSESDMKVSSIRSEFGANFKKAYGEKNISHVETSAINARSKMREAFKQRKRTNDFGKLNSDDIRNKHNPSNFAKDLKLAISNFLADK